MLTLESKLVHLKKDPDVKGTEKVKHTKDQKKYLQEINVNMNKKNSEVCRQQAVKQK